MLHRRTRKIVSLLAALGCIGAATSPLAVVEYQIPREGAFPHDPAVGRDGILWYTVQQSNMYGRFDPRTGEAKVWTVPTGRALPYGMVNAPDGSIWVALFGTNKLGHIDAETGALREITLPQNGARPRRIAVDEAGVVWYTEFARG